jgi:hypothetical protein
MVTASRRQSCAAAATAVAVMPNSSKRPPVVSGSADVLERHDPAAVAVTPAVADRGLDAHPRPHAGREHFVLTGQILHGEPLPAGHRDHTSGDAIVGEPLPGVRGELDLGAGRDQQQKRVPGG